jgi:hypothetical protein
MPDKRQWALSGPEPGIQLMTISPINSISAAGLAQYVLDAGDSNALQQTLQSLQSSLTSGDLSGAQSAFQSLQTLFQNSGPTGGTSLSSTSQLSTDMVALGGALSSGDLSTAQTAFSTVLGDLQNSPMPSQTNEAAAASQSLQLVQELLSSVNSSQASSSDLTTSILEDSYAAQSGLNVYA